MESDERGHSDPKAISARGHILQIQDFVRAILEDGNPGIDIVEARRSVACIEAIYRSSRERRPITVGPGEEGRS
jgi:predicted dehydrogenase